MREIKTADIITAVRALVIDANVKLSDDVVAALKGAIEREESPLGKDIIAQILVNADTAEKKQVPLCQDTGMAVFFIEIGQDVRITGGSLREALNEGVRQGYHDGYMRGSLKNLFTGENTGDNTPAIIHYDIVEGDRLSITFMAKGGGSENMSRVTALTPAEGIEGIRKYVVQRVRESGGNPCPPTIVGVGIGGTLEHAALLAKKAMLRPVGTFNPDQHIARLEQELLVDINRLGIGPQGLGGRVTALAVHILAAPHHIASIPVAVNLQCHSLRHKEVTL